MFVSLDEPEPVDSVIMFLSGYDTLEYSWVKATAVSVRLQIFIRDVTKYQQAFWRYCRGTVATLSSNSVIPTIICANLCKCAHALKF